jgi:hypothetical protein
MKLSLKSAAAGLTTLALAGGFAALGATSAFASGPTSPQVPYSPDVQSVGAIHLYDAAGNLKTTGSLTDAPFAAYAVADGVGVTPGDTKATLYIYTPVQNKAPSDWDGNSQLSLATTYPTAGVPSSIVGPNATASIAPDQTTLNDATSVADGIPNVSTSFAGLYELRLLTGIPGGTLDTTTYYSADIKVTGSTWTLVNPVPPAATPTVTTVTATPATGADTATSVTLNATVSPVAAGSVQFKDAGVAIGTAQTIAAGATASITHTFASAGSHPVTAEFTPTSSAFAASTGTLAYSVTGAIVSTTTALSANPQNGAAAYTAVALTATVGGAGAAGSVQFLDGTTSIGTVPVSAGAAVLNYTNFAQGSHSVTAKFIPADALAFSGSTSLAVVITTAAAAGPVPDSQTVVVTVLPGSLLINTPYTPLSPLTLPDMTLNSAGTLLTSAAQFGTTLTPIQVTDTRAGNLPWTASALAGAFDNGAGGFIDAQNLGLTNLQYVVTTGNALTATNVNVHDNAAASGVQYLAAGSLGLGGTSPHAFADTLHGTGTIGFTGTMTLNAPTSTVAGLYTSTVVFTIG